MKYRIVEGYDPLGNRCYRIQIEVKGWFGKPKWNWLTTGMYDIVVRYETADEARKEIEVQKGIDRKLEYAKAHPPRVLEEM